MGVIGQAVQTGRQNIKAMKGQNMGSAGVMAKNAGTVLGGFMSGVGRTFAGMFGARGGIKGQFKRGLWGSQYEAVEGGLASLRRGDIGPGTMSAGSLRRIEGGRFGGPPNWSARSANAWKGQRPTTIGGLRANTRQIRKGMVARGRELGGSEGLMRRQIGMYAGAGAAIGGSVYAMNEAGIETSTILGGAAAFATAGRYGAGKTGRAVAGLVGAGLTAPIF